MSEFQAARDLLHSFKGNTFMYGSGVIEKTGAFIADTADRAVLIHGKKSVAAHLARVEKSLAASGIHIVASTEGAAPNAPLTDMHRMAEFLAASDPDIIIGFGAGSTLDCIKAAEAVRTTGADIEDLFGLGKVTELLRQQSKTLTPMVAIQAAASSASHLTKYSNITNPKTIQKKLIVDEAIVPTLAVFDYDVTHSSPVELTIDGALDGISHSLEVWYGAAGTDNYAQISNIGRVSIRLLVENLPRVLANPLDQAGREALGLGTDLGGYAIMLGGTNGAHLNSFSFVDVLSHGRACGMLNPYYTVFFAPAIEAPMREVGAILASAGHSDLNFDDLSGRELGVALAEAMLAFIASLGIPTRLTDIDGFKPEHIERAINAAQNPQLRMKLENMPVPLSPESVDTYMRPVLEAAMDGNLGRIKNIEEIP